jgi:hypothetical protein
VVVEVCDVAAVTGSAVPVPVGALSCRLVNYVMSSFCYLLSFCMTCTLILRVMLAVYAEKSARYVSLQLTNHGVLPWH